MASSLKDNVWRVFWGCLIILLLVFIFFTYNASTIASEEGVETEDVFIPFAVIGWMYTPSSPIFGFSIFLSALALACILALQFYPGFQKRTLSSNTNSKNKNSNNS